MHLTRTTRQRNAPRAFKQTLLELLESQPWESISATKVITTSGYSRGSFYRYFTDLENLLDLLIQEEIENYIQLINNTLEQNISTNQESDRVRHIAYHLLKHVYEQRLFYRALFSPKVECIDFERFCEQAITHFKNTSEIALNITPSDH